MHPSLVLLTYGYMISYFVLLTAHFLFSQQVFYLGLSYDCLCDWKEFITLSASSIVLSISEWVCFEVGIIALGESVALHHILNCKIGHSLSTFYIY